jgi:hypothetical protein
LDGWSRFVAGVEERTTDVGGAGIIRAQELVLPRALPGDLPYELFSRPPEEIVPRNMERIPGQSGKEAASDIPSWARGIPRRIGETPQDCAKRLMDGKYGKSEWAD